MDRNNLSDSSSEEFSVADLHSKILDAPPPGSKFFQFHAVFGKFWQNRMLAPPLESWYPLLGENTGSATGFVPFFFHGSS